MAVRFLNREISELCLGKPALRWRVAATSTVAEAVLVLKRSGESSISVWNGEGRCVRKISMADVICFLCIEENLANPSKAFEASVTEILPKGTAIVRHLESKSRSTAAIDCNLEGARNLVVPIQNYTSFNSRTKLFSSTNLNSNLDYCWLTQEDVARFILSSIGVFSPLPALTIESLNIIDHNARTVRYHDPAFSALPSISLSVVDQTCIAVINEENKLVGEISPFNLACCDETVSAAIATLSAGDLMAYIDYGGPPDYLVQLVKMRLEEANLLSMLELIEEFSMSSLSSSSSSCSSDDESGSSRYSGSGRQSPARFSLVRRSEAILCHPWSSLVAVMIQALTHRVTSVWVVEEDHSLIGIVTLKGILEVFRSIANGHRTAGKEKCLKQ